MYGCGGGRGAREECGAGDIGARGGTTPRATSNGIVVRICTVGSGGRAGRPQPERIVGVVVGRGHIPAARSLKVTPRVAQSGPRHGGARDHAMSRLAGLRLPLPPVPGLRVLLHLPHSKSPATRLGAN